MHTNPVSADDKPPQGRWPPNVVLGRAAAAALDAQSGQFSNHARSDGRIGKGDGPGIFNPNAGKGLRESTAPKDFGGASKFFPVFDDRLDLMRWLVRLVTPPGGTVLDPFDGLTAEACKAEGFHCIVIRSESDTA